MMLYPNCSELVHRIHLAKITLSDEENKDIAKIMDLLKPYSDDKELCTDYVFCDEDNGEIIFRTRFDGSEEETMKDIDKILKKHKWTMQQIGDKPDIPLFSEGENFFYKIGKDVKVASIGFSNITEADKINKNLLKVWKRK